MNWYQISLSRQQVQNGEYLKIKRLIKAIVIAYSHDNKKKNIDIFSEEDDEGNCTIFFPKKSMIIPGIKDIVDSYKGIKCKPITDTPLSLIFGDIKSINK